MDKIPVYALYGEREQPFLPERLHCESIPERSRLYDWEIGLHRHDLFVQVLHVRAGSGESRLDGRVVSLKPPCVVWIPVRHEHGFRFSHDIDGEVITVVAQHADSLLGSEDLSARLRAPLCLPLDEDARGRAAAGALAMLSEEIHGRAVGRLAAIESSLRVALLRLARMATPEAAHPLGDRRTMAHVQRFTALIDRHFRGTKPLAFYARELGVSVPQLNRVCRRHLGGSALQVIQRRLLHEAERDLAYSSLSVKAIALTLGFADAAYFSRFFSRHAGCSPSEFRADACRRLGAGQVPDGAVGTKSRGA
jgi:AraC family transcriptional regulator, transcriptional activator of pobA